MIRYLYRFLAVWVLAGVWACWAEEDGGARPSALSKYIEKGMESSGVRFPLYNEDGSLQAQFFGQRLKVMEGTSVEIINLKVEVYREGRVAATIFAPQCFSNVDISKGTAQGSELFVHSDGEVLIEADEVTFSGRGFKLQTDGKKLRFEVLHDSKVLVKEAAQQMEGVRL